MSDNELYEIGTEDSEGDKLPEDNSAVEHYYTNSDPYFKIQPVPPERRNRNHWIDEDGNIRVKNPSAYWIPDAKFEMEIDGTVYTVTGSYEGKEMLDKKWRRILAKWAGENHDK